MGNFIRAFGFAQGSLVEGYSYPDKFFRSLLFPTDEHSL